MCSWLLLAFFLLNGNNRGTVGGGRTAISLLRINERNTTNEYSSQILNLIAIYCLFDHLPIQIAKYPYWFVSTRKMAQFLVAVCFFVLRSFFSVIVMDNQTNMPVFYDKLTHSILYSHSISLISWLCCCPCLVGPSNFIQRMTIILVLSVHILCLSFQFGSFCTESK